MENMQQLESSAVVANIYEQDGRQIVELNETIFYPQGGGQPYDQGKIENEENIFDVQEVRFVDGIVKHIGEFKSGKFEIGEQVKLHVEPARRALHARLHSGGHIVDMAVNSLGLEWIPGKGYHFPDGPYVEYQGSLPEDLHEREELRKNLENKMQQFVHSGIATQITFVSIDEMKSLVRFVPDNLPENKPSRVVLYGDFGVPCGGTHVANLREIGDIKIKKLAMKNGNVKVSYLIN